MAERKVGRVAYWQQLSPILAIFYLMPQEGSQFPGYKPGQYIALRRDDCRLTKKITVDGKAQIVPDLDETGKQKIGSVTHSYSIASAPYETEAHQYLGFYVVLEKDDEGSPGRLTESFFHMNLETDNQITYVDRITGDFTLDKRAAGCRRVMAVGTGTGLAPFASMIKQLHHEALEGKNDGVQYTLVHANRTREELAYHEELLAIEKAGKIDFVYLPSVSRPTHRDREDPDMGVGRANNVLRLIFGMPLKEEEDLKVAQETGGDVEIARAALERTTRPELPAHFSRDVVLHRLNPADSVVLSCGNPASMADIKLIAELNHIRFEKEDW